MLTPSLAVSLKVCSNRSHLPSRAASSHPDLPPVDTCQPNFALLTDPFRRFDCSMYPVRRAIRVRITRGVACCCWGRFDSGHLPYDLKDAIDPDEFAQSIRECNAGTTCNLVWAGRVVAALGLLLFLSNFITPWVVPNIFATFWILPVCGVGGIVLLVIGKTMTRRLVSIPTIRFETLSRINSWYNSEQRAEKRRQPNRTIRWACVSIGTQLTIMIDVEAEAGPASPLLAAVIGEQQARFAWQQQQPPPQQFQPIYSQAVPASGPLVVYHASPAYSPEVQPGYISAPPPAYAPSSTAEGVPAVPGGFPASPTPPVEGETGAPANFCSRCGARKSHAEDKFCSGCGFPYQR